LVNQALAIAIGTITLECIICRMVFDCIEEIDPSNVPHVPAVIGDMHVAVVSGPLFDEAL